MPAFLLMDVKTVWIHKGRRSFGGGNNNLLIHTEQGEKYICDNVLEECFVHESTHTSMDSKHAAAAGWLLPREKDRNAFLSEYGRDYPGREDLAECMGPYLAVTFRADRLLKEEGKNKITEASKIKMVRETIPNRCEYLDSLGLSLDIIE